MALTKTRAIPERRRRATSQAAPAKQERAAGENLLCCDGLVTYHPGFFEPARADELFERCQNELAWGQETARFFGRSVPLPRLTAWYGPIPYAYSGVVHRATAMAPVLAEIRDAIEVLAPGMDCVLANDYRNGRDSVSWHADDEAEWGNDPVIASVSFGATRRFSLRHRDAPARVAVDLEHGSLLVMAGATQRCWHHAILKTNREVAERINLTFRRWVVPPGTREKRAR